VIKKGEKERGSPAGMKDRIVKESIELFLRKGFKGTSIQAITDAIGITKGAFYWHFTSKDELLFEIIEKYEKELIDSLFEHMKGFQGDFLTMFYEYHKYINEYARNNGELCVLSTTLAAEISGSKSTAEKKIKAVYAKYIRFIRSLLEKGKKEGLFEDTFDTLLHAHVILAIHNGILLQWFMNRKTVDGPSLARAYRNVMLFGMVKGKAVE
jgi:AcrR family transcriptional regulator